MRDRSPLRRATEWSLLALVAAFELKSLVDLDSALTLAQLSVVSLPKIAGAAFLTLLGAHLWLDPRVYWFDRTHGLLLFIVVLCCVSTMTAVLPATAALTTFRYAAYVALYIGLSGLARDSPFRTRIVVVLVASCAVASIAAIAGLLTRQTLVANTPHGDANDLAFMLVSTLPLAIWLAGRSCTLRAYAWAMVALIALAALLTFSRGALLGLAAGITWLVLVERRYLRLVAAGVAIGVVVAALVLATNASRLHESYEAKRVVAQANVANRLAAWRFATGQTLANPLVGIGPGNFGIHYEAYWRAHPDAHRLRVVHNSYLEIAVELGIPALVAFVVFYATVFRRARQAMRNAVTGDAALLMALRISLVIAGVAGLFVSEQLAPPFWILTALASATWSDVQRRTAAA